MWRLGRESDIIADMKFLFSELNKFEFAREVIIYDLYKRNGQIMLSNLRYYFDECGCSYYI